MKTISDDTKVMPLKMTVALGLMCPPLTEQFPGIPDIEHYEADNKAISRLKVRGLISEAAAQRARTKLSMAVVKQAGATR